METITESSLTWVIAAFILHIIAGMKIFKAYRTERISESMFNPYIACAFAVGYVVYRLFVGPLPGIFISGIATLLIYVSTRLSRGRK